MSRIHDALRRQARPPRPAAPPRGQARAVRADAVLAALGSRSNPGGRTTLLVAAVAVVALTLALWAFWPASPSSARVSPSTQTRSAPRTPAAPVPVPEKRPLEKPPAEKPPLGVGPPVKAETPPMVATTRNAPRSTAAAARTVVEARPQIAREPEPDPTATTSAGDFQLALYYQRTGDFEQALLQYRKVLQHDELNAEAHNNLGMLYQGKGLYEDAVREYQRVIAIDPAYLTAHLNLSAALLKLGRADGAAAEARAVLAIDPRHSDALVNLALAQQSAGQPGDAQLSLRRAIEIDPHHPAAHYNLAQAYDKAGDAALAIEHYRQFLQYAGPEQVAYVADVRARIQALARGTK